MVWELDSNPCDTINGKPGNMISLAGLTDDFTRKKRINIQKTVDTLSPCKHGMIWLECTSVMTLIVGNMKLEKNI